MAVVGGLPLEGEMLAAIHWRYLSCMSLGLRGDQTALDLLK